ncbi:MAG: lipoate--protein ligase family protein [candidate division WOR-3 bacterium]
MSVFILFFLFNQKDEKKRKEVPFFRDCEFQKGKYFSTMWYLIDTGFNEPYFNMAYDESLMGMVNDKSTFFLRFFNFYPCSITIGYHQKPGEWLFELEKRGIKWVRRLTGGKAVLHLNDCTWSIVFHRDNPFLGGTLIESHKKICSVFKRAFELLGIKTEVKRQNFQKKKNKTSEFCFSSTSLSDLCWEGKKIMGSAQFRDKEIVLQEGTIILSPEEIIPLNSNVATIETALNKRISLPYIKEVIIQAFKENFGISYSIFKENPLKKELLMKYSSSEWNLNKKACFSL